MAEDARPEDARKPATMQLTCTDDYRWLILKLKEEGSPGPTEIYLTPEQARPIGVALINSAHALDGAGPFIDVVALDGLAAEDGRTDAAGDAT
jgi:hypothetical protein